jgi:predicted SnoaL-like aldol condensation-catalyzing enzyme
MAAMRSIVACVSLLLGTAAVWTATVAGSAEDATCAGQEYSTATTREVILAFEKLAFDERKPREAMEKYAAESFLDHDPNVTGDRASVIAHLEKLDWSTGGPQRAIKHLVVEGDIAVVHHHLVRKPGERGIAAVDIFRVRCGKFVEHWDVLQPIPDNSVNKQAMF